MKEEGRKNSAGSVSKSDPHADQVQLQIGG